MEIKVPNLAPVREAIHQMELKPQVFFVTGLVLAVLAIFAPASSVGLGLAAGSAFLAAAWGQAIMMEAFFKRAASAPPPAATAAPPQSPPAPAPPPPASEPPMPDGPIDLEPPSNSKAP